MLAKYRLSYSHLFCDLSQWSIKLHSGNSETLKQYKANLTAIAVHLDKLAEHAEIYWVLQGELRSKQITRLET